jgi:hypothetical protein
MKDNKTNSGKFWPYMLLGFLAIGITLGFWTVKSTIKLPVHESNEFMQKYQSADKDANEIIEAQNLFDSKYNLELKGLEKSSFKPKFLKRKPHQYYTLNESNNFSYKVTKKDGNAVNDANVTLLLTRPQTEKDDKVISNIKSNGSGEYIIKDLKVQKPGRYILRLKVSLGKAVKYLDTYAYKEPQK